MSRYPTRKPADPQAPNNDLTEVEHEDGAERSKEKYAAHGQWVPFPLDLMNLFHEGRIPKSVIWVLLAMLEGGGQTRVCTMSHARIAHFSGLCITAVKRALDLARAAGLIKLRQNSPGKPAEWLMPWVDEYLPNWGRKPSHSVPTPPSHSVPTPPSHFHQKPSHFRQKPSHSVATTRDSLRESLEDDSRCESSSRSEPPTSSSEESSETPPPTPSSVRKEERSEKNPPVPPTPPTEAMLEAGWNKLIAFQKKLDQAQSEDHPSNQIAKICKNALEAADRLYELAKAPNLQPIAHRYGFYDTGSPINQTLIYFEHTLEPIDPDWVKAREKDFDERNAEEGPSDASGATQRPKVEVETNPPDKSHLTHPGPKQPTPKTTTPKYKDSGLRKEDIPPGSRVVHQDHGLGSVVEGNHHRAVTVEFDFENSVRIGKEPIIRHILPAFLHLTPGETVRHWNPKSLEEDEKERKRQLDALDARKQQ